MLKKSVSVLEVTQCVDHHVLEVVHFHRFFEGHTVYQVFEVALWQNSPVNMPQAMLAQLADP